jgi:predicted amidohydrolase YtcJ
MNDFSRRKFLKGMGSVSMVPLIPFARFFKTSPDLVLYNATVYTVDPSFPAVQALAISNGRIMAVGKNKEMLRLAGSFTKKIDIGGKTITPGFIDAHTHPAYSGRAHLRYVDCSLNSIASIKQALREKLLKTPPGNWVVGFKYDDTKTSEKRFINRADLDEIAPDHPVLINHRGGHTAYVNSRALDLAAYDRSTKDPDGGKIGRDATSGDLTGQLLENAVQPLTRLIPNEFSRKDNQDAVKLISSMMARTGVTSVTDAEGNPDDLRAYQDAHHSGELATRVYCMIVIAHLDEMINAGIRTGLGDEWVRVGGVKLVSDGSISERTARLSVPYINRPNDYGITVTDEEQLYIYALKAHKADWQIGIHANGDVAIGQVLNVYEKLQKEYRRNDPRFRIEHCTVINEDLVARMKALNVIPTPFSTYVYFHGEKMKEYGRERLEHMFAVRTFLDAGIKVTQASDYPPGPFEPMMALQSSVTRTDMNGNVWGPSQKITVEQAIKVGTINGAYASYEEHIKGSLSPGKVADLVVLGKDPTKTDPMTIVDIPIERTMVDGKWIYES